jgi:hypothetical protein
VLILPKSNGLLKLESFPLIMKVIRIKILSNSNENPVLSTSFCVILLNFGGNPLFIYFIF